MMGFEQIFFPANAPRVDMYMTTDTDTVLIYHAIMRIMLHWLYLECRVIRQRVSSSRADEDIRAVWSPASPRRGPLQRVRGEQKLNMVLSEYVGKHFCSVLNNEVLWYSLEDIIGNTIRFESRMMQNVCSMCGAQVHSCPDNGSSSPGY